MRYFDLAELQKELEENGVPQYAARLKEQYGYDAVARKRRINPKEQELLDDSGRNSDRLNTTSA